MTDQAPSDHPPHGHMDAHATLSDDDHGHTETTLGPIDWAAWAYASVGAAAGMLVVLALWVALG